MKSLLLAVQDTRAAWIRRGLVPASEHRSQPSRATTYIALIAILVTVASLPASGQEKPAKKESRWAALLDVNLMVETYSNFLARKYDLNDEQAQYTNQMLRQKAEQFMSAHGDSVHELVDRMFDVRTGADMPAGELVDWGKRASPIYEEAKRLILDGNGEWRGILNDEQKKIHDEDMKLMNESFASTEDQLSRIVAGEMTVEEFRKPTRPGKTGRRPDHGRKSRDAQQPDPPPQTATPPEESPVPTDQGQQPVQSDGNPPADANPHGDVIVEPANDGPVEVITPVTQDQQPPQTPPGLPVDHGNRPDGTPPPEVPADQNDEHPATPDEQHQPPAEGQPEQPDGQPVETPVEHHEPPPAEHIEHAPPPAPQRDSAGVRPATTTAKFGLDYESKWDAFVKEFIQKYKLDEAQTQKANDILRDCKEQAGIYIKSKAGRIKELDEKIAGGGSPRTASSEPRTGDASTGKDSSKAGKGMHASPGRPATAGSKADPALAAERTKLLAPIDDIFEKRLKPRLESLPTRAQKAAAGSTKSPGKGESSASKSSGSIKDRLGKKGEKKDGP